MIVCAVVDEECAEFANEKLLAMDEVFYIVCRSVGLTVLKHLSAVFILDCRVGVLQRYHEVIHSSVVKWMR